MLYIPTNVKIDIEWSVKKGIGNEAEDFSRSTVSLFLFSDENRWTVPCTADYTGVVRAELPETLPEGVYSLELLWVKNGRSINETRCIQRTRKTCVFVIDAAAVLPASAQSRAIPGLPDIPPIEAPDPIPTVKMVTVAAPYGYDGLSAYESAVLRGKTSLSEEEWVKTLEIDINQVRVVDNLDSESATDALSARQGKILLSMIAPLADLQLGFDAAMDVLYIGGKSYKLEPYKTIVSTKKAYGDITATLTYSDIPPGGGTVSPTLKYSQVETTTQTYSDGSTTNSTRTITSGATVTYSGEGVDSAGKVSANANSATSRKKVTTVSASVSLNGKSKTVTADVYQAAASVQAYYGHVDWSSHINESAGTIEPPSVLTAAECNAAISSGTMTQGSASVTESAPKKFNVPSGNMFVALIPSSASKKVLQFDGISSYVAFDTPDGLHLNGEYSVTLNGVAYDVFAQIAYMDTDFQIITQNK